MLYRPLVFPPKIALTAYTLVGVPALLFFARLLVAFARNGTFKKDRSVSDVALFGNIYVGFVSIGILLFIYLIYSRNRSDRSSIGLAIYLLISFFLLNYSASLLSIRQLPSDWILVLIAALLSISCFVVGWLDGWKLCKKGFAE